MPAEWIADDPTAEGGEAAEAAEEGKAAEEGEAAEEVDQPAAPPPSPEEAGVAAVQAADATTQTQLHLLMDIVSALAEQVGKLRRDNPPPPPAALH